MKNIAKEFSLLLVVLRMNAEGLLNLSQDTVLDLFGMVNLILFQARPSDKTTFYEFLKSMNKDDYDIFMKFYSKEQMTYFSPKIKALFDILETPDGKTMMDVIYGVMERGKLEVSEKEALAVNNTLESLEKIDKGFVENIKVKTQACMMLCRDYKCFKY